MTVKSRLLEILEKEKGETLSGEKLAEELHCTRAAIWKAVKSLREEGYMIEAGPNKGYMLVKANDRLSVEAIRPFLSFPEVYIKVYQEVDSTNRAAKAAAITGEAGHGSFVLAGCQTEGRGRRGRSFYSPQDTGIYLSVILEPKGSLQESLLLTAEAAVAVYRAVKKITGVELDIKWVNDLYHNGKKVCGILTEAVTDFESGNIEFAVVGIGLNIFEAADGYPDSLKGIAGGIYENREAAGELDRSRLAAEIVNALLEETRELRLPQEYIEHNLVPGREICISDGDKIRRAKALEICPDGRLKVEEADGSLSVLSYGEVSIII